MGVHVGVSMCSECVRVEGVSMGVREGVGV